MSPDPDARPVSVPLRVGIVGCGAITELHHLPAVAAVPDLVPTVLVDTDVARAQRLATAFGVPLATNDLAAAAAQCDLAIVAVPNRFHSPVACELLARGRHVLVEKPMATTVAEADAMLRAATVGRALLAVGLEFRFFPVCELVRGIVESGILGPLGRFDLRLGVVSRWPFASDAFLRRDLTGGGVLVDYGSHLLDLVLWWCGDWVDVAYRDDARGGVESDCELDLVLRSGAVGRVEISRSRNLRNTCILQGALATLEVGLWDPDGEVTLRLAGARQGGAMLVGRGRAEGESRAPGMAEVFAAQLADLRDAIHERRQPRVPGAEGRRSLTLTEACYARREPLVYPWEAAAPDAVAVG